MAYDSAATEPMYQQSHNERATATDTAIDKSSGATYNGATANTALNSTAKTESALTDNAKLILRAYIELETVEFDQSMQALNNAVSSMGGYFENNETYNYSGNRYCNLTVRIPKNQYDAFINQAQGICHVLTIQESKENVVEQYYDTELRLKTQQTKYQRLQELLARAENMEDIITIEAAISDTEMQIEQLKGTLRNYDSLIDYATINISLQEVYKLANIAEMPSSFTERLQNAFTNGFHNFGNTMEDLIIGIAYNIFGLILFIIFIIVAIIAIKQIIRRPDRLTRKKIKQAAKQPNNSTPTAEANNDTNDNIKPN